MHCKYIVLYCHVNLVLHWQKLLDEVHGLDGKKKDVVVLSANVCKYLTNVSETAKAEVEETVSKLREKYQR